MASLYLTAHEQSLYDNLQEDYKLAWDSYLSNEEEDAFETEHQSRYRLGMLKLEDMPEVQLLYKQVGSAIKEHDLTSVRFGELSPKVLQLFFSAIGANGVSALIEVGIQKVESLTDLEAIACLSRIRHGLLKSNRVFFTSAA